MIAELARVAVVYLLNCTTHLTASTQHARTSLTIPCHVIGSRAGARRCAVAPAAAAAAALCAVRKATRRSAHGQHMRTTRACQGRATKHGAANTRAAARGAPHVAAAAPCTPRSTTAHAVQGAALRSCSLQRSSAADAAVGCPGARCSQRSQQGGHLGDGGRGVRKLSAQLGAAAPVARRAPLWRAACVHTRCCPQRLSSPSCASVIARLLAIGTASWLVRLRGGSGV